MKLHITTLVKKVIVTICGIRCDFMFRVCNFFAFFTGQLL